jgi:hypothetical protein
MEMVSDRDRRIDIADVNTSQLLAHATRQAYRRRFGVMRPSLWLTKIVRASGKQGAAR